MYYELFVILPSRLKMCAQDTKSCIGLTHMQYSPMELYLYIICEISSNCTYFCRIALGVEKGKWYNVLIVIGADHYNI